jgi:hypothetical protein
MIVFFLSRGTQGVGRALAAATLPVIILTGGYIFIHSKLVGEVDLGMAEYSYFTFEQGHGLAYQFKYDGTENFYVAGQMDARRVFGTPEENRYSIKTAILRDPAAYLERIPALIRQVPRYAIETYGGGIGIVILLFAARGILELIRNKLYKPLSVLLLWSGYLVIYPY